MFNFIMRLFLLKNEKTGQPSYTLTAFILGSLIVNLKLILSGVEFNDHIKMGLFSGIDYAAAIAALGGLYSLNKHVTNKIQEKKNEKNVS